MTKRLFERVTTVGLIWIGCILNAMVVWLVAKLFHTSLLSMLKYTIVVTVVSFAIMLILGMREMRRDEDL